jgi:hypothetical protein
MLLPGKWSVSLGGSSPLQRRSAGVGELVQINGEAIVCPKEARGVPIDGLQDILFQTLLPRRHGPAATGLTLVRRSGGLTEQRRPCAL